MLLPATMMRSLLRPVTQTLAAGDVAVVAGQVPAVVKRLRRNVRPAEVLGQHAPGCAMANSPTRRSPSSRRSASRTRSAVPGMRRTGREHTDIGTALGLRRVGSAVACQAQAIATTSTLSG